MVLNLKSRLAYSRGATFASAADDRLGTEVCRLPRGGFGQAENHHVAAGGRGALKMLGRATFTRVSVSWASGKFKEDRILFRHLPGCFFKVGEPRKCLWVLKPSVTFCKTWGNHSGSKKQPMPGRILAYGLMNIINQGASD